MILKAQRQETQTSNLAADLSLIISEFSKTIEQYECENKIPISMWVEIEDKKTELIRVLNIINDEVVNLQDFDHNSDISNSIAAANDTPPLASSNGITIKRSKKRKYDNCNVCNPISIDFNLKLNKPEIKLALSDSIEISDMMFRNNTEVVCSTALVLSQGCIPDLVKIIGTLLMAINTLMTSVNLESISLSGFMSASIGAVLDVMIKKGMFIKTISVTKSDCLSSMIKEILYKLPTSQSLNDRLDPDLLKNFGLFNKNPTNLQKMYEGIDRKITNKGISSVDAIYENMSSVLSVLDSATDRVNTWIDGLFSLSSYLPCEKARSNTPPSKIIEEVMNLISMINVIRALIDNKYKKEICGLGNEETTTKDIAKVISEVIDVEKVVVDKDGNTIGIILPSSELRTVYLDVFGCNLPTFLEVITSGLDIEQSNIGNQETPSSNSTPGRTEEGENYYDNSFFHSNKPLPVSASSNYSVNKPLSVTIDELDKDIIYSSNYVDIQDSFAVVSGLMAQITEEQILSQALIIEKEEQLADRDKVELEPEEPMAITSISNLESVLEELNLLSGGVITIGNTTECEK